MVKSDYYKELTAQAVRIKAMLSAKQEERTKLKSEADRWRLIIADKLAEDVLPTVDRRDLMFMIQNLGYISYEVWHLPSLHLFDSEEGQLMKNTLKECLSALAEEMEKFKTKTACVSRLRSMAYKLLSVWHSSFSAGCDSMLCDGYEAVGDAILRLADSMETVMAGN